MPQAALADRSAERIAATRSRRAAGDEERPVEEYQTLVRQIAHQVARSLPRHVEVDELVAAGNMGLVEAAGRYDASRGVRFESFIAERVRGAIIDHLRAMDWAPRSVRAAGRRLEESRTRLTARLGRTPTEDELAADCDMTVEALRTVHGAQRRSVVLALDRPAGDRDEEDGDELGAVVVDDDVPAPEDMLERKETVGLLADVINCLPGQARTVIGMYYFEGMQMSEIGEMLGVTQSRASQIHSAALELLRDAIAAQMDPESAEDWSNPQGRKAKRLARFFTDVAETTDWRDRLTEANRTVELDLSPAIRMMEERHGMTSAEFLAARASGAPDETDDQRRWYGLLVKAGVAT